MFDMTADYKVIELLCIIDEFCKHFDAENAGNLLEDRVKIILYQSNKVAFTVTVLSMFRRRNGDGWKGRKRGVEWALCMYRFEVLGCSVPTDLLL